VNVSFENFWPGFDKSNNFFISVLENLLSSNVAVSESKSADLIICSVFSSNPIQKVIKKKSSAITWFYTGENVRPNYDAYDAIFSFDYSSRANAFRLPLWWMYLDLNRASSEDSLWDNMINPWTLDKPRSTFLSEECFRSVSAFIGNQTRVRAAAIEKIPSNFSFEGFGSSFSNPVSSKMAYRGKFGFNICFENSYFPGYHTEKLLQAWAMGSVPLYYGSKTVSLDFNPSSFINLADYDSFDDFWDFIRSLSQHDVQSMINQPLLKDTFTLKPLFDFVRSSLGVSHE
jgi:hypothetical protein